jgi:UDP-N-acetylenolpyruvoylglucosamine reductase
MTNIQKLKTILGERARENEPLGLYTTFKIGGPADLFFDAKTVEELVTAVTEARKLGVDVFVLGGGTNILIGDKGIRGLVVKNSTSGIRVKGMKGQSNAGAQTRLVYVEADSGVIINKLVRFTAEVGLRGI